jgi:hypothetical protein
VGPRVVEVSAELAAEMGQVGQEQETDKALVSE